MDIKDLTEEEEILVQKYIDELKKNRKSWLEKEAEEYARLNEDYFNEIGNVDIKPIIEDCYRNAIYNFKNKILELFDKYSHTSTFDYGGSIGYIDEKSITRCDIKDMFDYILGD